MVLNAKKFLTSGYAYFYIANSIENFTMSVRYSCTKISVLYNVLIFRTVFGTNFSFFSVKSAKIFHLTLTKKLTYLNISLLLSISIEPFLSISKCPSTWINYTFSLLNSVSGSEHNTVIGAPMSFTIRHSLHSSVLYFLTLASGLSLKKLHFCDAC